MIRKSEHMKFLNFFLYILKMLIQNMRKYTKEEFQIFKAGRGAISENAQFEVRQTLLSLQKLPYWFQCVNPVNNKHFKI